MPPLWEPRLAFPGSPGRGGRWLFGALMLTQTNANKPARGARDPGGGATSWLPASADRGRAAKANACLWSGTPSRHPKARFKPFSIDFNSRDLSVRIPPSQAARPHCKRPQCHRAEGSSSPRSCPAARRPPRATGASPAPSPRRWRLRPAAGPGPRQDRSRRCRTRSAASGALARRCRWTAQRSGRSSAGAGTRGTLRGTVWGRSLCAVTWFSTPGPEDASEMLPGLLAPQEAEPFARRWEPQVPLSCSRRRGEGLCAGTGACPPGGDPSGSRRCPGGGGRPGLGGGEGGGRRTLSLAGRSRVRDPAACSGSQVPAPSPCARGQGREGVGGRWPEWGRGESEPDLRLFAPKLPFSGTTPSSGPVYFCTWCACACLRASRSFREHFHFESPMLERARRAGPGRGGGPGGGAGRWGLPRAQAWALREGPGLAAERGVRDGGGVGKERKGCGEEP